jgi:hypothetical protein
MQLNFLEFCVSLRLIIIIQNTDIIIRGYKYASFCSSYAETDLLLFPGTQLNPATVPRGMVAHDFWEGESPLAEDALPRARSRRHFPRSKPVS